MKTETVQIQVLYFQKLRDLTGRESERIPIRQGEKVSGLLKHLYLKYPELKKHAPSILVAVNEEYAKRNQVLNSGDVVALLPPMSGG